MSFENAVEIVREYQDAEFVLSALEEAGATKHVARQAIFSVFGFDPFQ